MSDRCSTNPGATHYEGCPCHEQGWRNKWECAVEMAAQAEARLEAVQSELDRLLAVMQAATVLIAAKGRHNTQLAYQGLRDALVLHKSPDLQDNAP
jgi:hypothetical protein